MKYALKFVTLALILTALCLHPPKTKRKLSASETAQVQATITATADEAVENLAQLQKPCGFRMEVCTDIKTALLMPDDWYFKEETVMRVIRYCSVHHATGYGAVRRLPYRAGSIYANHADDWKPFNGYPGRFCQSRNNYKILDAWDYTYGDHTNTI